MFKRFLVLAAIVSALALAPMHSAAAGGRHYQPGVGSTQGYYEYGNGHDYRRHDGYRYDNYRYDNYRHGYRDRSRFSAQIYIAPSYAPRVYAAPRYRYYDEDGRYGYGDRDYGYGASVIRCESRNQRVTYCGFYGPRVTLARQVSRAGCVYGHSWGIDRNGLWVANGCRGEFYAH